MTVRAALTLPLTFACLLLPVLGAAQQGGVESRLRTTTIPRVATPPTIEDYLDGTPRPDETTLTEFVQREPGDGVPASQPTEAYLSYDDMHLYVIFVARDREPDQVRASLTRREGFGNDDFVGVILDTFHDKRRAYLFISNPLGVQLDGVSTDGEHDDYSFDTLWQSDGRLTPFGYVVWMAIPFKSIRFPNTGEQEWGIGLTRAIRRNNETSFWPYLTRRIAGMGQQLGDARGLRDISPGRNMQFIPYGALAGARFLDEPRADYVRETDLRVGVDAKMVIKDAFTLDATFNPDFSQIESDEPQVTINQRFEVFFPEKRPFFIENASYFDTPINLFFSRRIVDPQVGARVTGKRNRWAIGALGIDDREPGRQVEPDSDAFGDRAGIGVLRVQRDFARESSIGILATTRQFGGGSSGVISADGRYKISDTWVLTGQAAASTLEPLDGTSTSGRAFSVNLDRTGRNWGAFLEYEDISPGFRAPLGFVRRTDLRQIHPFVRYTWYPAQGPLVSLRPELSGSALWDHAGTLQDWESGLEFQVELKGQTEFEFEYGESMERFAGVDFRKQQRSVRFETAWLKWLELSARYEIEDEINFYPAEGLSPFVSDATGAELSITWKPVAPLRIDQTYLFTRLQAPAGVPGARQGAVIVDNHITRTRAAYQFSRALSLRAIVDYSTVRPDRTLIDLESDKRFSADFLLTYLVNPWTAIYVGYTDGYGNVGLDPDSPFRSMGRQVFVKSSYLFRF